MRGRTNASNGGIFLNATTDDFEVAIGNSIVAGDFVEYKYDTGVKELNTIFSGESYLVDATTHTYIALFGNYPTLFTYIDGDITIVDTYSTYTPYIARLDDTHYVINDSSNSKKFMLISCTPSEITLVAQSSGTASGITGMISVDATTVAYTISSYLYKVTTDDNYTQITINSSSVNVGATCYLVGATADNIVVCSSSNSSSTYTNTFKLYAISNLGYVGTFSYTTYNNKLVFTPNLVIADRYMFGWSTAQYGSSSPFNYYQTLYVFDAVDKRLVTSITIQDDISLNSINPTILVVSKSNNNNEFVLCLNVSSTAQLIKSYAYVFTFNPELSTITKSEKTEILKKMSTVLKFGEKKYGFMIDNEGYINADITLGRVVIGTPTNTVQEWSGGLNPLGVAKQSGNAGNTIAVYIPQVNS